MIILECLPKRNTEIGKKYIKYLNILQKNNPVSGELLKRRIRDLKYLIEHNSQNWQ